MLPFVSTIWNHAQSIKGDAKDRIKHGSNARIWCDKIDPGKAAIGLPFIV